MAANLKFQNEFNMYQMVIPLFLHDKIGEVERHLSCSHSLQREFLKILDGIVGNEIQICDLVDLSNVKEIKGQKSPKIIFKLGIRLMKKYNISSDTCPHIMHRHKLSSLRYLFTKHYNLNELSLDSLILFTKEISEDSIPLKAEVLDLFVEYYDCYSGLKFLQEENIPKENIPHQIISLLDDKNEMETERMRHDKLRLGLVEKLKPENFYSITIPMESILKINNVEDFNNALCQLKCCSLIAMDTEWKPNLQYNKEEELMLLQIATHDKVYLFDMLNLQNLLKPENWNSLGEIFSNANITKVTYSFAADTKCLGEYNYILKEHVKKISNVIDLNDTKKLLLDFYPDFFSYSHDEDNDINHKGLSEMVFLCFGKPLDKMEQCSYWSLRPLSQKQILYAALDAFCLLNIYDYLNKKAIDLNYSDWRYLKPSLSKTPGLNKNKKNKKSNFSQRTRPLDIKCNKKVLASEFKVVCDSMLQGLGKLLRSCNIDTIILSSSDYHDKCIEYYEKEKRITLTRGNVFHLIRKSIPPSHILCLRSDNVKIQLEEVKRTFGVIICDADIFARCGGCNSNDFLTVIPKVIVKMKSFRSKPGATPKWVSVDGGRASFDVHEGVTDKGVKLQLEKVPFGVLNKVASVYVCSSCGKCYWDGSHLGKVRNNISHLMEPSVPYIPVPPPQGCSRKY